MRTAVIIALAVCLQAALGRVSTEGRLNEHVKAYEPLHLDEEMFFQRNRFTRALHADTFQFNFKAYGRKFKVTLERAQIFTSDVKFTVDGQEKEADFDLSSRQYYSGHLDGETHSFAHFRVATDGTIKGSIATTTESYHISPSSWHFDDQQPFNHVIYRGSDNEAPAQKRHQIDSIKSLPAQPLADGEQRRSRRAAYSAGNTQCQVALVADSLFFENVGNSVQSTTIDEMVEHFNYAAAIFAAEFPSGSTTPITMAVGLVQVQANSGTDPYRAVSGDTGTTYLNRFSATNWEAYCLAHAFTYFDFSGGLLGLAWVGSSASDTPGGICQTATGPAAERKYTNTGFTTSLNEGRRISDTQASIVTTHEFGHNFGSSHDTTTPASGGEYIMSVYATSGDDDNNDNFSPASKSAIEAVVSAKGGCFTAPQAAICGNALVESGEQCDCGGSSSCTSIDSCCATDQSCTFLAGKLCTPLDPVHGLCCQSTCQPTTGTVTCKAETECQQAATCANTVSAAICQDPVNKADDTLCESNNKICNTGSCSVSICDMWGLTECSIPGDLCHIACTESATCKLTNALSASPRGTVPSGTIAKAPNAPCEFITGNADSGYCDTNGICQEANTESTLQEDLANKVKDLYNAFLADENVQKALNWLKQENAGLPNWAWLTIGIVGTCFLGMLFAKCRPKQKAGAV